MVKRIVILLIFLTAVSAVYSESSKQYIREGNELYKKKKYTDSEVKYRKSLETEDRSYKGAFNLGDALYKQGNYSKAAEQFIDITNQSLDKKTIAKAWHNLGNSYLQNKDYKQSINAFENSLKNNPKDNETRYNLEYAKQMLAKQQQQQQKNNKNQQQNKDQKQNQQNKQNQQQNKQQNKDQKENQQNKQNQQQKQNQGQKKDQQQQQAGQQEQMKKDQQQQGQKQKVQRISKEDAKRLLQALSREERKVQKRIQKKKGGNRSKYKNW